MSGKFQHLTSLLNLIVFFILLCNTFGDIPYYSYQGERLIVIKILRGIGAQFVLLSEIKALGPYYVENFKAFMFPKGRAIYYFIFAIGCFSISWYGIVGLVIIAIIGLITLCCRASDPNHSPYLDPPNEGNPNPNPIPPYYQPAFHSQPPSSHGTFNTSTQPLNGKQPQQSA